MKDLVYFHRCSLHKCITAQGFKKKLRGFSRIGRVMLWACVGLLALQPAGETRSVYMPLQVSSAQVMALWTQPDNLPFTEGSWEAPEPAPREEKKEMDCSAEE